MTNNIHDIEDLINQIIDSLDGSQTPEKFNSSAMLHLINNMNTAVVKAYKQKLLTIWNALSDYYFKKNSPLITDSDFDKFEKILQPKTLFNELPNNNELFITTQPNIKHSIPMLSLDKFLVAKDVENFVKRVNRYLNDAPDTQYIYCVEPKIDGNSIALVYENGKLVKALSRGDGVFGELLTLNMLGILGIPQQLSGLYPNLIEVRGEIFMSHQAFLNLNRAQQEKGKKEFANPRNATAGTLRNLDPNIVAERSLQFMPWGFGVVDNNWLQSSAFSNMEALKKLGFHVNPHNKLCNNIQQAIEHYEYLGLIRNNLEYEIDGVVFKIDSLALQKRLGETEKAPRWAGAYKFTSLMEKTQILGITLQIGRSGVITPVAQLKPVNVAGVVISRATLHNFDYITSKDIRIGDFVLIKRAGDVIPQVIEVDLTLRGHHIMPYEIPMYCPNCGSTLIKDNAFLKCNNNVYGCSAIFLRSLEHMVSKGAFDIEGLATKQLEFFIQQKFISMPHHIFELKQYANQILNLEGFQEKSLNNLLTSIEKAKTIGFDKFIYALGINQIGEKMAKILAKNFSDINILIAKINSKEELKIQGIGESILEDLYVYFSNDQNIQMIKQLLMHVNIVPFVNPQIMGPLTNKKILFTGTLNMNRREAQNLAERHGAIILSAVSKNLDMLIYGDSPGSKLNKAKELNVETLSEQDFLKLIDHS